VEAGESGGWGDGGWEARVGRSGGWKESSWEAGVWKPGVLKVGAWKTGHWEEGVGKAGTSWETEGWEAGVGRTGDWEAGVKKTRFETTEVHRQSLFGTTGLEEGFWNESISDPSNSWYVVCFARNKLVV
jgi:hypothetical protein